MSSIEAWFSDCEEEKASDLAIRRRRIRDASNPLDLPDETFVQYFRVSKDLFLYLLNILEAKINPPVGSQAILPIFKLSVALRFFAEGGYQRGAGNDLFVGMAQPTVSKGLSEVLDIFEAVVCPQVIKFPSGDSEKSSIKHAFFQKTGFPGVIGCIDGTHIKIVAPSKDKHLFYNRKGFYSINVMLVCDHTLMIRYVDANHPGSSHDSFVFNASSLSSYLNTRYERGERNTWLLGDAGYPLKPFLITPYRTGANDEIEKLRFNEKHSRTRITVERSIGVLKATFRCTLGARELHYGPEKASQIVNVVCALHNLRIKFNINLDEAVDIETDNSSEIPSTYNDDDRNANRIRDDLLNSFM
ncbi:putative nuclease HARBI1 [Topomyia yanbarensis]|uniref:putative nuclease HARBI1 n=1 Tax=Topomyia yanbarensis TaxID=2498891 RepID=UPI00273C6B61|nr:putative nuclease HARBI1 [Topomyia yanbarensis]XP_058838643.1 putative nuclease HARBI1 [Topomyia yanbarensis]